MSRRRVPIMFGVALLAHMLGLWLLFGREPLVIKSVAQSSEARVTIQLGPPPAQPVPHELPSPAPSPPDKKIARRSPQPRHIRNPTVTIQTAPAPVVPSQPEPARTETSPPEDMSTQLEAARKRRADAAAPQDAQTQDDNSVARANVASSIRQAMGAGQNESGGVFQIRRLGLHDAEFMFRGWSKNANRNSSRLITVEQGAHVDIQSAVTQKMIEIIREQKSDTFIWESHRLDREITLSARKEDTIELQRFLMREFFQDHVSPARR